VNRLAFNSPVNLKFRHALSRVYVKAGNANEEAVVIKAISLNRLYSQGSLDLDGIGWSDDTPLGTDAGKEEVSINEGYKATPPAPTGPNHYKVLWDFTGQQNTASYHYVLPESGISVAAKTLVADAKYVVSKEQGMLILPQHTTGDGDGLVEGANGLEEDDNVNDGDEFFVEVAYQISNVKDTIKATFADLNGIDGKGLTFEFGRQYALTLNFIGSAIKFEIDVEDWDEPIIDVLPPCVHFSRLGVPGWIPVPQGALDDQLSSGANDQCEHYDWLHFKEYNEGAKSSATALIPGTKLSLAKAQMASFGDKDATNVAGTANYTGDPDMAVYGGLYQWGRPLNEHGARSSSTTPDPLTPVTYPTSTEFIISNNPWYNNTVNQPWTLWGKNKGDNNYNLSDQTITWGKGSIEAAGNFRVPSQYEWALLVSMDTSGTNSVGAYTNANKVKDPTGDSHLRSEYGVVPLGNPNIVWFPVVNGEISQSFGSGMCGYAIYLATDSAAVISASSGIGHLYDDGAPEPLLFLPAGGYRYYYDGAVGDVGGNGGYWSSTVKSAYDTWGLNFFDDGGVYVDGLHTGFDRAYGLSVRCLSE
jgi:hypothetical protein